MGSQERKERERQIKAKLFLDIAEELFFSNGYENTTIDDIVKQAEYSKGTLYQYYASKEVLLLNICLRGIMLLKNLFVSSVAKESTGLDKIEATGNAYYKFMLEHHNYYEIMGKLNLVNFQDEKNNEVLAQLGQTGTQIDTIMEESLITGIKDGTIRDSIDVKMTVQLLKGMSDGVFRQINSMKNLPANICSHSSKQLFEQYFEFLKIILKK